MNTTAADLVEIVRDFLTAHRIMRRLFDSYRTGALQFAELRELIDDDEGSVLYRLKEKCHALFRPRDPEAGTSMQREALFDLAVGSLFHEAMKFRENFYQREFYGPRVRVLRSQGKQGDEAIFREFEKILEAVSARLEEALQENETLVEQTGRQLRVLLAGYPENEFVMRYLIENRQKVEDGFGTSLEELLAELTGSAAEGFRRAGRSYLDSGFYREADAALAAAIEHGGEQARLDPLRHYARGMMAYLVGNYGDCISQLSQWQQGWEQGTGEKDESLRAIACSAVSKIGQLVDPKDREHIVPAATALVERLTAPPLPTRTPNPAGSPA